MIATNAIHQAGDISRYTPDICFVHREDAENYYGNWVFGYGFIDVRFPKETTRDLTPEEIGEWHGKAICLGDFVSFINITGEELPKRVTVRKVGGGKERAGELRVPLKKGNPIALLNDREFWRTSVIQEIDGNLVKTKNSVYAVDIL